MGRALPKLATDVGLGADPLKALMAAIDESVLLLDRTGAIVEANETAVQRLGVERGLLLGESVWRFLPEEAIQSRKAALRKVFETGEPVKTEDVGNRERRYRTTWYPVLDDQGGVGQVAVFGRDITSGTELDEEKYRELVEEINDVIFSVDLEGVIAYVSPAARDALGYDPSDLVGRTYTELIDPRDLPTVQEAWKDVLNGDLHPSEYRMLDPSGETVWVRTSSRPIVEDGAVKGVRGVLSNISRQKQTEEALRESEQRFRSITEQSSDLIALTDLNGVITYASPSAVRLFAASPEEMVGKAFTEYLDESSIPAAMQAFRESVEKKRKVHHLQLLMKRSDGHRFHGELSGSFYSFPSAQGTLVVIRDISERKRLEEEIRQADKMKAVGTLAGGIAHDFNNILGIIIGNTELALCDLPSWSPVRENLSEVHAATLRARDLVKQILLFARQREHTVAPIRVEPIAEETLRMVRVSIPGNVEVRPDVEAGLPSILADPSQIQQIIMNLCTNAGQVMETEGGTLTFTLDAVNLEEPLATSIGPIPEGLYVRMQVGDTGPGIPKALLERIFDPFFTTKGVGEGTGLGLAVVHGVIQERNGGLTVESEEGVGTTFSVYLPAEETETVEEADPVTESPRGFERILFVDDEPMIMRLGQRMLQRQGYAVEAFENGAEALECFNRDPDLFDLVVTDMTMPGMRGDHLAVAISAIRPDIPVILATGYSEQISEEKAKAMGIRAFVLKPLTQHELATTVREVLDEQ